MRLRLRREYGRFITSGGQLVLLAVGAEIDTPTGWAACAGLISIISLIAWASTWRRARAFDDTPTSKVASAAQGYTELLGIGKPLAGSPLLAALSQLPCLWYRYRIEHRRDNKWEHEESGESDASFILDDGTGQCVVDPEGAEVVPARRDRWTQGDRRFTEWLLLENDPLYALGQFKTLGSQDLKLDRDGDMKALLADWKTEPRELLRRFDLDGNGELDLREWELARAQARREIDRQHREARLQPELHVMRLPDDRRLYVISTLQPAALSKRYRRWSIAHLAIFFAALTGAAYALVMSA